MSTAPSCSALKGIEEIDDGNLMLHVHKEQIEPRVCRASGEKNEGLRIYPNRESQSSMEM